jgi:hypothetical protein
MKELQDTLVQVDTYLVLQNTCRYVVVVIVGVVRLTAAAVANVKVNVVRTSVLQGYSSWVTAANSASSSRMTKGIFLRVI